MPEIRGGLDRNLGSVTSRESNFELADAGPRRINMMALGALVPVGVYHVDRDVDVVYQANDIVNNEAGGNGRLVGNRHVLRPGEREVAQHLFGCGGNPRGVAVN